jgi:hypothetical protein
LPASPPADPHAAREQAAGLPSWLPSAEAASALSFRAGEPPRLGGEPGVVKIHLKIDLFLGLVIHEFESIDLLPAIRFVLEICESFVVIDVCFAVEVRW